MAVIKNVSDRLAHKFVFGYFTVEDIKQQAFIEACKGLEKYDGVRPLENFLWVHIKNRLGNFKRDNYERLDKPCLNCPLKAYDKNLVSECKLYNNKSECDLYRAWSNRNTPKKNLINCLDIDNVDDTREAGMSFMVDMDQQMEYRRVVDLIDSKIPLRLRQSYVKLRAGLKISNRDKDEIQVIVKEALAEKEELSG